MIIGMVLDRSGSHKQSPPPSPDLLPRLSEKWVLAYGAQKEPANATLPVGCLLIMIVLSLKDKSGTHRDLGLSSPNEASSPVPKT